MGRLPEILETILLRRGVAAADIASFLYPSLEDLAKPEELPGIVEAADAVLGAVAANRLVVVFGDYDCDGVCATAIVVKALEAVGARVQAFLPERLGEGYGMSDASVSRMLEEHPGVGLVVTVDNGINSVGQIAALKDRGVSVVVTDHHLPGDELPSADALVDPKVAAPPHLENLCGAGVAFLLANRIVAEAKRRGMYSGPNVGGPLLVLAGLATVTDIMPLVGQNRIIVSEALKRFGAWAPLGLKELYFRAARSGCDRLTSRDFGFLLGPRINAAGRLASGMDALDLILETNRERAREYALRIDLNNTERKSIEIKMTDEAMGKVVAGAPAQVIDLPDGHPGVAGIVAARVLERLGGTVPVCVLASGHGSARAPDGINIRDAFVACADLLDTFGGHAAAGGFSVKPGRVEEFRTRLCEYCRALKAEIVCHGDEPELWIEPGDVTLELAESLQLMEPFGECNEEPVFGLRGVTFSDVRPLGSDGRHLAVQLRGSGLRAVWWAHGSRVEELRASGFATHDIAFTIAISEYGERHAELRLVSMD